MIEGSDDPSGEPEASGTGNTRRNAVFGHRDTRFLHLSILEVGNRIFPTVGGNDCVFEGVFVFFFWQQYIGRHYELRARTRRSLETIGFFG